MASPDQDPVYRGRTYTQFDYSIDRPNPKLTYDRFGKDSRSSMNRGGVLTILALIGFAFLACQTTNSSPRPCVEEAFKNPNPGTSTSWTDLRNWERRHVVTDGAYTNYRGQCIFPTPSSS